MLYQSQSIGLRLPRTINLTPRAGSADVDRGLTTELNFANFLVIDLPFIVAVASTERLNLAVEMTLPTDYCAIGAYDVPSCRRGNCIVSNIHCEPLKNVAVCFRL